MSPRNPPKLFASVTNPPQTDEDHQDRSVPSRPAGCTELYPICTQSAPNAPMPCSPLGASEVSSPLMLMLLSRPVGPPSSAAPAVALLGLSKPQRQRGGLAWLIDGVDEHSKPSHI